jgi:hypothetical protein
MPPISPRLSDTIDRRSVDSLTKLHRRVKNIDIALDDRNDLNTTRRAWNEVRDNIERGRFSDWNRSHPTLTINTEAQTRQAFLSTLTVDVVQPLTSLKVCYMRHPSQFRCDAGMTLPQETQDRTRKRIKEDLKDSISAYTDFADNILPKLKRTYLRKCQDVEVCV